MEDSGFIWMFPCYVLASNVTVAPHSGEVIYDEHLRFAAPEITSGGEQGVAIFTDRHLAEDFLEKCGLAGELKPHELSHPIDLLKFLKCALPTFRRVIVDLNPKTRRGSVREIQEIIGEIAPWEFPPDNPGDQ